MYSRSLGTSPHSLFFLWLPPLCCIFQCRFLVLCSALEQGQCATTDISENPECPHFKPETTKKLSQNMRHFWIFWVNFIQGKPDMKRDLVLLFFFLVTLIIFSYCFRLYLKGHSGTAGKQSSLILHGAEFSTKDADNDNCMCKCALMLTGGEYNSENMWYINRNLLCFPKATMDEVAFMDV